ncbi:CotH kinase family protein [uncultured Ruthenibacterium sp.]|uniref:CotH kinase family protein n=1 Tax=uncultured Ruthenibacterium sp. TaxID=1905347 RepID=UPI00349E6CBF
MRMEKQHRLMAALGFAACCAVIAAITLVGVRLKLTPADPYLAGRDYLSAIHSTYHQKGSYTGDVLESFVLKSGNNGDLSFDVEGYFVDTDLYLFLPPGVDATSLCASFVTDGGGVQLNGKFLFSGLSRADYTGEPTLVCGDTSYTVYIRRTSLPVVSFETFDSEPVYSKEQKVTTVFSLYDETGALTLSQTGSVRVRGNSTAQYPKLPYHLDLREDASLLGLPASRDYVLLANFSDSSLLRNTLTHTMARELSVDAVMDSRFVELYMNGQYQGVYDLGTHVGVETVGLSETGWIAELDARTAGTPLSWQSPVYGVPIKIKDLGENVSEKTAWKAIRSIVTRMEQALASPDFCQGGRRYTDLIDVDSFAANYLLQELSKNRDFHNPYSTFLYEKNGVLYMGPVWDMDQGYGNAAEPQYTSAEGLVQQAFWFERMAQDPVFVAAVEKKLEELGPFLADLDGWLAVQNQLLDNAATNNFIPTYIGLNDRMNTPADYSHKAMAQELGGWVTGRSRWLEENLHPSLQAGAVSDIIN